MKPLPDIVPVKCNVQFTVLDQFGCNLLFDLFNDTVGYVNSPGLNSNQHCVHQVNMVFQDLVTQPLQGDGQLLRVQDGLQENNFCKNKQMRPLSFLAQKRIAVRGSRVECLFNGPCAQPAVEI